MKNWNNAVTQDSWRLLKYNAETVNGFEKLLEVGPSISIFGSARTSPKDIYYKKTIEIAKMIADMGFGVISGAGPGIMEAANKGAKENNGKSVGLRINLPFEQYTNKYVDEDYLLKFDYFFIRKLMFQKYSQGFIVMPGGYGTLDELFNALTLIQTKKSKLFPIILVGKKHYKPLYDWIINTLLDGNLISEEDIHLLSLVEDVDEVKSILTTFFEKNKIDINFD
ncbi:MAG: TIGR00730 family Rossman fold protein [Flammeovirgaceae bacterium]|nr:TIGR00730 family Rossman fold protein [Marinoscillum sp.]MAR65341.1 TIGR00730 family Rossman fold protein [Flammeovirgaceae bacterium]OUX26838.1 MAG: Rossman fold protein, TIGR00730 family [Flammeovirgaceae bacterium TMED262]PDH44590.1 MAG: TIGR00730 family Rossman fold protein [Rhodothermaeota bacterium MED-G18]|tara:strand:- start:1326 stop:1997 length:672 start_codon:yes stop_codon:yes gene_type:complete